MERCMNSSYRYIVVEGGIGAGKTTLARRFAADLHAKLILEEFEDNPFLPKFYIDPDRYALPLELSFLADRYKQLQREVVLSDIFQPQLVADYCFYKSLIFAEQTLHQDEFKLFRQFFFILAQQIPSPDLIIYLYETPERLKQQIIKRGRPYEQNISLTYLDAIQKSYLAYFKLQDDFPILLVDMNGIDFVQNEKDYEFLLSLLDQKYEKGIHPITGKK
jgi:deoxyadenosine/deoxycytidine kinase